MTHRARQSRAVCVRPADVRCQPTGCALSLYRSSRWGAPRLRAVTSRPSLLARLFPSGAQSPSLFLPSRRSRSSECANAHPTGSLAKNGAPYSVAPLLVRRPRFSLSAHRLRFPSLRGSCSSAVALAPPRFPPRAMRRAPIHHRSGVVSVRLSLKRPARKKLPKACGAKNNQFSEVWFRFNMRGFRVPRAPATARRGGYSLIIVLGTPRCPATY